MAEKRYIEIRVSDNGIGMDQSQLERIFDMFSHVPSDVSQQGTGIGLSICRKIIRNHAGYIAIRSEINEGATVSIILPIGLTLSLLYDGRLIAGEPFYGNM